MLMLCFPQKFHLPPSVSDPDQSTSTEKSEELFSSGSTHGCSSGDTDVLDF